MTKINFNEREIARLINQDLYDSINNLNQAVRLSSGLSIPSSFDYKKYLTTLDDELKKDLKVLVDIYNVIQDSTKTYSKINDEVIFSVKSIENYSVPLRNSAIK